MSYQFYRANADKPLSRTRLAFGGIALASGIAAVLFVFSFVL